MRSEHLLAQALSYAALIAATLEYAILVRHRTELRTAAAQIAEAQEIGLRGLVRVFLVDEQPREAAGRRQPWRRRARDSHGGAAGPGGPGERGVPGGTGGRGGHGGRGTSRWQWPQPR